MGNFDAEWLQHTILVLPPLLLSLTLHEFAHARVALAFGDPTAYKLGRVSLNPLRHLDPVGTLMLVFSGVIGWAKPVPVNRFNLRPPRLGEIMVSVAGPLTNLALALIAGALLRTWVAIGPAVPKAMADTVPIMLFWTALANLAMCFFNLIPLFPLDGHHIVRELLPAGSQEGFMRWQMRFGGMLLMVLLLGPKLVEAVTGRPPPVDPLRAYLAGVIMPAMRLMGLYLP